MPRKILTNTRRLFKRRAPVTSHPDAANEQRDGEEEFRREKEEEGREELRRNLSYRLKNFSKREYPNDNDSSDESLDSGVNSSNRRRNRHRDQFYGEGELSKKRKIGIRAIITLLFGYVVLISAVAFLSFLWFGDRNGRNWRRFMLNGWLARAITLTALAMRFGVTYQAVIYTSMLAAVTFEAHGVSPHLAAEISIMRYSNGGPFGLLYAHLVEKSLWRNWSRLLGIAILTASTLLLQFSSTLLLSDIGTGPVLGFSTGQILNSGYRLESANSFYSLQKDNRSPNAMLSKFTMSFPTFGEYSEAPKGTDNRDDTGTLLRALLPVKSDLDRQPLQKIVGPVTVFDARTVCVRPSFKGNLSVDENPATVHGRLGPPPKDVSGLIYDSPGDGIPFNCTYSLDGPSVCSLPPQAGGLISELDRQYPTREQVIWSDGVWTTPQLSMRGGEISIGNAYLVLWNLTVRNSLTGNDPCLGVNDCVQRNESLKLSTSIENNVMATLCYDACSEGSWGEYNLTLSSDRSSSEPTLKYNSTAAQFETRQHREQYGALGGVSIGASHGRFIPLSFDRWEKALLLQRQIERRQTTYPRPGCVGDVLGRGQDLAITIKQSPNAFQSALTSDILQNTGSASLALQAYSTMLVSMSFYERLDSFDKQSEFKTSSWSTVSIPTQVKGLTTVFTLLGLHFIVTFVVVIAYLRMSRLTMLGNAWHVVAQINLTENDALVKHASLATDDELKWAWLDREPQNFVSPRILRHGQGVGLKGTKEVL